MSGFWGFGVFGFGLFWGCLGFLGVEEGGGDGGEGGVFGRGEVGRREEVGGGRRWGEGGREEGERDFQGLFGGRGRPDEILI